MGENSTDSSPIVFGVYHDYTEHWQSVFGADMHRYRRTPYAEKGNSLNILHVSTDLKAASGEMSEITRFLESRCFSDECMHKPKDWSDADILIIGSDERHSECAVNMAKYISSSSGIVMPLDVLLYGLHGKIIPGMLPVDRPLLTNKFFGIDGICMAHSRMRRWVDNIVIVGIITSKIIGVENCIDAVMGWNNEWFAEKVDAFKEKVRDDGRLDYEAELFFAAVDVARECRNVSVHVQKHNPNNKDRTREKTSKFNRLATMQALSKSSFYRPIWCSFTRVLLVLIPSYMAEISCDQEHDDRCIPCQDSRRCAWHTLDTCHAFLALFHYNSRL